MSQAIEFNEIMGDLDSHLAVYQTRITGAEEDLQEALSN